MSHTPTFILKIVVNISLYRLALLVAGDSPIPDGEPVNLNKHSLHFHFNPLNFKTQLISQTLTLSRKI